jgi:hypothetical protein
MIITKFKNPRIKEKFKNAIEEKAEYRADELDLKEKDERDQKEKEKEDRDQKEKKQNNGLNSILLLLTIASVISALYTFIYDYYNSPQILYNKIFLSINILLYVLLIIAGIVFWVTYKPNQK